MNITNHNVAVSVLCGVLGLINFRSAPAHHSYSMFDLAKKSQVSGTVRTLEWMNPHVWLWLGVPAEKGGAAIYAFEGTSINEMSRRSGWTKNVVTAGDKVTVKFSPFKDGRNGGRIEAVTLADGRVLNADRGIILPPPKEAAPTDK